MRSLFLLLAFVVMPAAASAEPLPQFDSIELRSGGEVLVRYGSSQSVELVEGDRRHTRIRVEGRRLVIANCADACPRHHAQRVEIVAPRLEAAAIESGGTIEVGGGFPEQRAIAAAVSNGGTIDLRRLSVQTVTATVSEGGRILARPAGRLDARISNGGVVTYWGEAAVRRSVRGGGVVARGRPADADRPLTQLDALRPLPRIRPIPSTLE